MVMFLENYWSTFDKILDKRIGLKFYFKQILFDCTSESLVVILNIHCLQCRKVMHFVRQKCLCWVKTEFLHKYASEILKVGPM